MEIVKGYLRDLKEAMIGKESGDKGKTPMDPGPSAVPATDHRDTTPSGGEPTPNMHPPTGGTPFRQPPGVENVDRGEETSEIGQKGNDYQGGSTGRSVSPVGLTTVCR